MTLTPTRLAIWLALPTFVLSAACAGPGASGASSAGQAPGPSAPQRLVAAIQGDPHTVYGDLNPSSNIPGIEAIESMLNAEFALTDNNRVLVPVLAEAVPTTENGLWKVFPDGRMEVTWRIRSGVLWHDGLPLTSADYLFLSRVQQDPELPVLLSSVYRFIERIEAPDEQTIVITWKQPYIKGDTTTLGYPMARHILEAVYSEGDKLAFTDHPYFSGEFVGTGAFKLTRFEPNSHLIMEANDRFVLGRPKIDEVEVRFIPDQNTLIANIRAGAVQIGLGRGLSLEQAQLTVEQYPEARMSTIYTNFLALYPQFVDPNPPIVANLQFRRALLHGLDRQNMAEVLQGGLVPVAHSLVSPNEPDYPAIEPSIVKYEHDPRKAMALIEALGYTRGPDGFLVDHSGQRIFVQVRTSATREISEQAILAAADAWKRLGVDGETWITPPQLARDREFRSTYSAFELAQQPNDLRSLDRYHSSKRPLPENRFQTTGNRARYASPALDALIDRYLVTIPAQERLGVISQLIHHLTDNIVHMPLFYGVEPVLMNKRLQNVNGRDTWDAFRWELR